MPGGDRTGPWGMGPGSGRGAGFCAGFNAPGYMNPGPGRGFWRASGPTPGMGGHGWRNWFRATGQPGWLRGGWDGYAAGPAAFTPENEKQMLEQQLQGLESELERIKRRLGELSSPRQEEG